MKRFFYSRLAWNGIRKNRQTYLPYILTCIGIVMMFYIISFLSRSEAVSAMPGGDSMQMILSMGCGVIDVFALIFLFYTNSFLIRRRKKEFGLYNILGMGKWNLGRILIWESLIIYVISMAGGLLCGILFSKAAELCMTNILGGTVSFTFTVGFSSIAQTLTLFAAIFLLILLNTLRQIHVSKPVELLHSESVGEKPPKANWLLALIGAVILGCAYYVAVKVEEPLAAMLWFFVAVIMVIIATYMLFTAGSVAVCKLLQKNRRYYYRTNHFVSVSSMAYRLKRNGAGLASICILSTMVLVMLSSTVCLYIGTEESLRTRYPGNIVVDTYSIEEQHVTRVQEAVQSTLAEHGLIQENVLDYRYLDVAGLLEGDRVMFDKSSMTGFELTDAGKMRQIFFVPLEDYNRLMGSAETLEADQVLICSTDTDYPYDTISIEGCGTLKIKAVVPGFLDNGNDAMQVLPSIYLFVPDLDVMEDVFDIQAEKYGDNRSYKHYYYCFDLDCADEEQIAVYDGIKEKVRQLQIDDNRFPSVTVESVANERGGFYALYGGLFFLGVLLGLVFIFAAVLIMYYKQVSEGYEDQSRFEIMQKVGMTKKEIKKSINSQVLTVFFLPLVTAGVHVAFAFPMISKLLALFNLLNTKLLILVTAGCFLVFSLFYVLVYNMTSRAYYNIVSGRKE